MSHRPATAVGLALLALGAGCDGKRADDGERGGKHGKHKDHGKGKDREAAVDPWAAAPAARSCERLPYPATVPVPEASGAVWLAGAGAGTVLVVGDSGRGGTYVELGGEDGALVGKGTLPLGDGAGDDLEGLATDGARLWALTSAGWLRAWVRDGKGFRLVAGPYPIEAGTGCGPSSVNCGRDYEGLCLRPAGKPGADGCAGYAAARADGRLYCLEAGADGRLRLAAPDGHPGPPVTRKHALADCVVASDGAVWTGDNLVGGAIVRRVAPPWSEPLGDGFPEAMALAPGGVLYRFSDTGEEPSLAARFRCPEVSGPAASAIGTGP